MGKTVLITGASSGIGKATAEVFAEQGWNVVATMRLPDGGGDLCAHENVLCTRLDVTDSSSIESAIACGIQEFGRIDAVVNNAGYGAVGPFEAASEEELRKQFDVNVFGVMAVTQAILPHFREHRSGSIVNVSSMGGRVTFPLYSVYHATKWAIEGFSESLQFELEPFNIRVKLIEPGAIQTDFYSRSMNVFEKEGLSAYDDYTQTRLAKMHSAGHSGSSPRAVAKVIFRAANDASGRLRYPAAGGAWGILLLRRLLPTRLFNALIRWRLS